MALEVNNVTKRFGDKIAVQDLNFKVERGQVFGLLGLNGAGKSTTIRIILNILQPDEGTVAWNGRPAEGAHHRFGYLPEERGCEKLSHYPVAAFFISNSAHAWCDGPWRSMSCLLSQFPGKCQIPVLLALTR
ncbi:ATP-binding cassette domain-containing protein [Alicyclobacillus pomorum]|uniref:ATP-binding cassette domain-containing protein n=1 Tax=Alicyclobacillus pomorum TaxID=204470 RepID=UPI000411A242|nr:ATP-binding cassette domain-containing protein [Alicyclobacillus pomorum]